MSHIKPALGARLVSIYVLVQAVGGVSMRLPAWTWEGFMTAWNSKKVESWNLRSHGICVVVPEPKETDDLVKRLPCTGRHTSALDCKRSGQACDPRCETACSASVSNRWAAWPPYQVG